MSSYRLVAVVGAGLSLASTASGLYNFTADTEAGAAGVANFLYFILGELLWRTKDGRDTFLTKEQESDKKENEETETKKKKSGAAVYDRATTLLCGTTLALNALISNIICLRQKGASSSSNSTKHQNLSQLGQYATPLRVVAWSSMLGAFLIRRWAMLTLGSRFTMALATVKDHKVCRQGPFRFIRHPGYLANGMKMASYAFLVTGDAKMAGFATLAWLFTWTIRVHFEEKMLKNDANIGSDYQKYCGEVTSKFIPFIY